MKRVVRRHEHLVSIVAFVLRFCYNLFLLRCALSRYGRRRKFGEHKEAQELLVAIAESNSSFLSALQTSRMHHNSIVLVEMYIQTSGKRILAKRFAHGISVHYWVMVHAYVY